MKFSFLNDYAEGAHPAILKKLEEISLEQAGGYGCDQLTEDTAQLLRDKVQNQQCDVHFVSGGTQANLVVLAALLKSYEAVISPDSAHINVHEAGAIEATGHKIIGVKSQDGKLKPEQIKQALGRHTDEHMVKPGAVFISNATELGTVYSKHELENIFELCRESKLRLFLDGARLGAALCSANCDTALPDISKLTDVFYIGGTKNGAWLGEALIINDPSLKESFRYHLKQRGALLAKGRILSAQFHELFRGSLWFDLARHANLQAQQLAEGLRALGFRFLSDSPTNQIFPILPDELIEKMKCDYGFYVWTKINPGFSAIRLVTSWATPPSAVDEFLADLERASKSKQS